MFAVGDMFGLGVPEEMSIVVLFLLFVAYRRLLGPAEIDEDRGLQ